jgi:hypothetical protein
MPFHKRAAALAMVRRLQEETEQREAGRWAFIDLVDQRPGDISLLGYAIYRGWIAVAPGGHRVMVTEAGRRAITGSMVLVRAPLQGNARRHDEMVLGGSDRPQIAGAGALAIIEAAKL